MPQILKYPLTQKFFPLGLLIAVERELLRNAMLLYNTVAQFVKLLLLQLDPSAWEPSTTSSSLRLLEGPGSHQLRAPLPNNDIKYWAPLSSALLPDSCGVSLCVSTCLLKTDAWLRDLRDYPHRELW